MKIMHKLTPLILAGFGLSAPWSFGTTFDFSYNFQDGTHTKVTGSLEGTQNGEFVDNITDVKVFFNGTPMSGAVFTATDQGGVWKDGPVVSFEVAQNNFLFDNASNPNFSTESFSIAPLRSEPLAEAFGSSPPIVDATDINAAQANWSLSPASAPDGGLTLAMLGTATGGLMFIRRKC